MRKGRARALGAVAAAGLAFLLGVDGAASLRLLARLPGRVGAEALLALVRRGDDAGCRQALRTLADPGADPALRVRLASTFADLRDPEAIPALVLAVNEGEVSVAAACARALLAFDPSGRVFSPADTPELRGAVVRDWNRWWRGREERVPEAASRTAGPSGGDRHPRSAARVPDLEAGR